MEQVAQTRICKGVWCFHSALWDQVGYPFYIRTLLIEFRRTAKASLTSQLTIPKQTRYLVGIELGKVERHVSPIT
jgi:hypothetical protein